MATVLLPYQKVIVDQPVVGQTYKGQTEIKFERCLVCGSQEDLNKIGLGQKPLLIFKGGKWETGELVRSKFFLCKTHSDKKDKFWRIVFVLGTLTTAILIFLGTRNLLNSLLSWLIMFVALLIVSPIIGLLMQLISNQFLQVFNPTMSEKSIRVSTDYSNSILVFDFQYIERAKEFADEFGGIVLSDSNIETYFVRRDWKNILIMIFSGLMGLSLTGLLIWAIVTIIASAMQGDFGPIKRLGLLGFGLMIAEAVVAYIVDLLFFQSLPRKHFIISKEGMQVGWGWPRHEYFYILWKDAGIFYFDQENRKLVIQNQKPDETDLTRITPKKRKTLLKRIIDGLKEDERNGQIIQELQSFLGQNV
jgi:hypothetical protein